MLELRKRRTRAADRHRFEAAPHIVLQLRGGGKLRRPIMREAGCESARQIETRSGCGAVRQPEERTCAGEIQTALRLVIDAGAVSEAEPRGIVRTEQESEIVSDAPIVSVEQESCIG